MKLDNYYCIKDYENVFKKGVFYTFVRNYKGVRLFNNEKYMTNLTCKIFGHRKLIRDYYPGDPIASIVCDRCNKLLDVNVNPNYDFTNETHKKIVKIKSENDLTDGKIYEILHNRDGMYCIKNDIGKVFYYSCIKFISIKEYRKQKLNKLNEIQC
jgi:hypothetical protein